MKIGIIGSRRRNSEDDYKKVEDALLECVNVESDIIISGGCPKGGDRFAEQLSTYYKIPITIYKADWDTHGKIAGFLRNTTIAQESDMLIACVAEDRKGGTEDTIKKFIKFHPNKKIILV